MRTGRLIQMFMILMVALAGCHDPTDSEEATVEQPPALTTEDITKVLKMNVWQVRLPDDYSLYDYIGLTLKDANGFVGGRGGSSGWQAGSIVHVAIWPSYDGQRLNYVIFNSELSAHDGLKKGNKRISSILSQDKIVNTGDVLMTLSSEPAFESDEKELEVILYVEKGTEPVALQDI